MKFVTRKFSKGFWDMIILWNKTPDDIRIKSMYDALEEWEQLNFDYHKQFKQNAIERIKIKQYGKRI
jgi:hypothetical protein